MIEKMSFQRNFVDKATTAQNQIRCAKMERKQWSGSEANMGFFGLQRTTKS